MLRGKKIQKVLAALTGAALLQLPTCSIDLDSLLGGVVDTACDAMGFPNNLLCDVVDLDFGGEEDAV